MLVITSSWKGANSITPSGNTGLQSRVFLYNTSVNEAS